MKNQLKPLIASLGLLGFVSLPVYAETENTQQIEKLEKEMAQLQHELKVLKTKVNTHHTEIKKVKQKTPVKSTVDRSANVPANYNSVINAPPYDLPKTGVSYLPIDIDVPGQSFVSTGPYLGVPLEYSGSNLIINNPQINEDVSLLKLRRNVNRRLAELGIPHPEDHGHLLLSGEVEAQANYKYRGPNSGSSDIDVTTAKLDAYILGPSSWTSGLLTFAYDNDIGSSSGVITSMHRVSNSRVFVDKAFITIGDFTKSPYYGSVGQMYVPFGIYSTTQVTSPVTKTLGRTKGRALLVGYQGVGDRSGYASGYVFRGDSYPNGSARKINNGGINVGYRFGYATYRTDIGAGYIVNIADSNGMQQTGNASGGLFGGFGSTSLNCGPGGFTSCGNEGLVHRVPAFDVHGLFALDNNWNFIAEYVWSTTRFNPNDLSISGQGAHPQALSSELAYTFSAWDRPSTIAGSYQFTKDTLAIGLPAKRYSLVFNTSIWRDTLQSLEFRHDIDYSGNVVSTGSGVTGPTGTGRSDNVITAQLDLFF